MGITWLGERYRMCGIADVYIDGVLMTSVGVYAVAPRPVVDSTTTPRVAAAMEVQRSVPLFTARIANGGPRSAVRKGLGGREAGKPWASLGVVALYAALACAPPPSRSVTPPIEAPALAFTHVTVVDVVDGTLHAEQTVLIRGTRIRAIGPAAHIRIPRATQVVDARGKYLLPGLWDMHAHLWHFKRYFPETQYALYIVNGVTGIRSLNVPCIDEALRWRRAIAVGERIGPRQVISGPALDGGDGFPEICGDRLIPQHIGVSTVARAQMLVDSLKAAGADFLKVYRPTREVYFALEAAARHAGIPLGGHAVGEGTTEDLLAISDSGLRIADHGPGLEGVCIDLRNLNASADASAAAPTAPPTVSLEKCRSLVQRLRRNGTWIDIEGGMLADDLTWRIRNSRLRYWPDSVVAKRAVDSVPGTKEDEENGRRRRGIAHEMELAEKVGAPFTTGTDASPVLWWNGGPGFTLPDVVVSLVNFGASPLFALQAATLNPAKALHATDSLGTVAVGKLADLVLLDGNPLQDIHQIRAIRAVVANGRYFGRATLDSVFAGLAEAARSTTP